MDVLRRGRGAYRQGDLAESFSEGEDADGGAQAIASRPSVVGDGSRGDDDEAVSDTPDEVVLAQRVAQHLDEGTDGRFGRRENGSGGLSRIDFAHENGHGLPRGSRGDR